MTFRMAIILDLFTAIKGSDATQFGREWKFQNLPESKRQILLGKRLKMVVVREPLERLLSAYRNKIAPMRDDFFGKWSREIIKNYRTDQNDHRSTTFSYDFEIRVTMVAI